MSVTDRRPAAATASSDPARDPSALAVRYVSMPGSPYAGSTLLGFLLDAHPACASIGAATGLTSRVDLSTYRCSCGSAFVACAFWNDVAARTRALGAAVDVFSTGYWNTHVTVSRRRWLDGILVRSLGPPWATGLRDALVWRTPPIGRVLSQARASTWSLARAVLDRTGSTVFVDTARDHQRPKYLIARGTREAPLDVRVIHLVRDPRGNVASIVKHTGADVRTAARRWRHYNAEADRMRAFVPPVAFLRLRYEDLCADPQGTLDRLARFVGVEPAPVPADLTSTEHHIIGNSMRLGGIGEIREDLSWRERLGREDLRAIARIAGAVSHDLGYDWP